MVSLHLPVKGPRAALLLPFRAPQSSSQTPGHSGSPSLRVGVGLEEEAAGKPWQETLCCADF